MRKNIFNFLLASALSAAAFFSMAPLASAQVGEQNRQPNYRQLTDPDKSADMSAAKRSYMASIYEQMADCLRSGREFQACKKEMKSALRQMWVKELCTQSQTTQGQAPQGQNNHEPQGREQ